MTKNLIAHMQIGIIKELYKQELLTKDELELSIEDIKSKYPNEMEEKD